MEKAKRDRINIIMSIIYELKKKEGDHSETIAVLEKTKETILEELRNETEKNKGVGRNFYK